MHRQGWRPDEAWLWGVHPVTEALTSAPRIIEVVHIATGRRDPGLVEIADRAAAAGIEVRGCSPGFLDDKSRGGTHQGVVARTLAYPYAPEDQLAAVPRGLLIALDCIQDPRNLGAILRTAHAVGAAGVLLPRDRAVGVTPAAVRSAGGYAYRVPVARVTNLSRSLERLRSEGWWVVGLDPGTERPVWEARTCERTLLVVGGEGRGLRPLVARSCDELLGIPMLPGIESLNAAVAAGIALYEVGPRRRARPLG